TTFEEVAARYARELAVDAAKAWHHVDYFVREAARHGFASREPFAREPYAGRAHHLTPRLRELWLHELFVCSHSSRTISRRDCASCGCTRTTRATSPARTASSPPARRGTAACRPKSS